MYIEHSVCGRCDFCVVLHGKVQGSHHDYSIPQMRKEVNYLFEIMKLVMQWPLLSAECRLRARHCIAHFRYFVSSYFHNGIDRHCYSHLANEENKLGKLKRMSQIFHDERVMKPKFGPKTPQCLSSVPTCLHPAALCTIRYHSPLSSCTVQKPRCHAGNFSHLPHCIYYQFLSISYSPPILLPPMASMLIQAMIIYLDSCSYCPAGHSVSTIYSIQTISYILTRVNFKKCKWGHITLLLKSLQQPSILLMVAAIIPSVVFVSLQYGIPAHLSSLFEN